MYKLIGEDKNSFHVRHADGTTVQVAKAGLDKDYSAKIKGLPRLKLAEGADMMMAGDAGDAGGSGPAPEKKEKAGPLNFDLATHSRFSPVAALGVSGVNAAHGGYVNYADGGNVTKVGSDQHEQTAADKLVAGAFGKGYDAGPLPKDKKTQGYADGGMVRHYDQGTGSVENADIDFANAQKAFEKGAINQDTLNQVQAKYAANNEGVPQVPLAPEADESGASDQASGSAPTPTPAAGEAPQATNVSEAESGQAPKAPVTDQAGAPTPTPQAGMLAGLENVYGQAQPGATLQAGAAAVGKANVDAAQAQAGALADAAADIEMRKVQLQKAEQNRQAVFIKKGKEYEDAIADYQKLHIDPNDYWNHVTAFGNNTAGKVTAAISIALGALGAGLTGHGGNQALEIIDRAIGRNIDAQKMEIEKAGRGVTLKGNVLSELRARFGDERQAEAVMTALGWDTAKLQMQQIAAQSNSDIAKANSLNMSAQLDQKKHEAMLPFQIQAAQMEQVNQLKTGQLGPVNIESPLIPKEVRERFVPGLGLAPDVKTADEARSHKAATDTFNQLLNQAIDFRKQHGFTVLDRNTVNYGKTLMANLQDQYRLINREGVFKPAEKAFIESMLPNDPTKLGYVLPQLNAVRDIVNRGAKNYWSALGFNKGGNSGAVAMAPH